MSRIFLSHSSHDNVHWQAPEILRTLNEDLLFYFGSIDAEIEEFEIQVQKAYQMDCLATLPDPIWQGALNHHGEHLAFKKQKAIETLERLKKASPSYPFKPSVIEKLSEKLGVYPVFARLDLIIYSGNWQPSPEFTRLIDKGFELKKHPETTTTDMERFEQELAEAGIEDQLAWLPPWIRAISLYRTERFVEALPYFEQAFELGKYRAGKSQYLLVNQYLEACAKANYRGKFNKGLDWASYAGIKVRWIRDEEQTKEVVDRAFEILKMGTYIV